MLLQYANQTSTSFNPSGLERASLRLADTSNAPLQDTLGSKKLLVDFFLVEEWKKSRSFKAGLLSIIFGLLDLDCDSKAASQREKGTTGRHRACEICCMSSDQRTGEG
jgi:hypothetical protein